MLLLLNYFTFISDSICNLLISDSVVVVKSDDDSRCYHNYYCLH